MTRCANCDNAIPPGGRFCRNCGLRASDPGAETVMLEEENDAVLASIRSELAGDYSIERELGRGGMAIVFLAIDINLGRRVALKVLPPEMALRRSMADRFKREAKMAASLDHPNIIPIYRVGQGRGLLYIAMKYIDGRALDEIIEGQGALPITVVLQVLRAAARALAYAHERGIVHRDVKSANIMIDKEGRVVVSDFGIARAIEEPALTATGVVVGTPYFMSPEQCAARPVAPQGDQYSLGVVAFHMLTGCVPFNADTVPGIMHHHFYTPIPDIRHSRPDAPPELVDFVNRLLSKKPEHRFHSTEALSVAIQKIPLSERERRHAEVLLRDLAIGVPIPGVVAAPLPPLVSTVRFTPEENKAIPVTRFKWHHSVQRAAAVLLGVLMLWTGGYWWSGRFTAADASPLPAHDSTAPPVGAATIASLVIERDGPPAPIATDRPPSTPAHADPPGTDPPVREGPARVGKVRVGAYPASADIIIDNRLVGTGVVVDSVLPAGLRRLRITAPGYAPFDTVFEVRAGETAQIARIALKPLEEMP